VARVTLNNVHKIYDGTVPNKKRWYEVWKPASTRRSVHVVNDVSLEIRDGEFLVLVGPSGCGKSTTLRMIAGLEDITRGEIHIDDRLVNELAPKDRDIAMVFQNYALYPHMNVYDNMAFGLRVRSRGKMPAAEIEQRVREAAKLLDIEEYLLRKPRELSGGQRQRVAMGRAIVRRPKVFLMDEPLSNLDAKLRVQMRAELQKLHRTLGVTTVYVTHDQTEALTLGHRIVLMRDGVIQQLDTPLAIYHQPANKYVAGFIGSPPMNFAEATVEGQRLRGGAFELPLPAGLASSFSSPSSPASHGQRVILGVRPENIQENPLPHGGALTARVEVSETMGAEVYVHLRCGDDIFVARFASDTQARVGDTMTVYVDVSRVHVFDKETEKAITAGPPLPPDQAEGKSVETPAS
jgi:multiple sugar transport system ATP-binding protein